MIRLGEIYIGLGRRGQNIFGHLVRFSRLRKMIISDLHSDKFETPQLYSCGRRFYS